MDRLLHGRGILCAHLGHDDHRLLALVPLDTERDDVAGAHALEPADGAFDVFRENVAAADDDDVLDPSADDEFTVEDVAEIAGAQPSVVEQRSSGVGSLVVAGRHRRTADEELADVSFWKLLTAVGVHDAQLEIRHGLAEHRQAANRIGFRVRSQLDRFRDAIAFQHDPVDIVGQKPSMADGECSPDGHFGHTECREDAARLETESSGSFDERLDRGRIDGFGPAQGERQP